MAVNAEEVVDLLCELVDVDSRNPPGDERPALDVVLRQLEPLRPEEVIVFEPLPRRVSAIVRLPCPTADAPVLAVNAHLDTAHTEDSQWSDGTARARLAGGDVIGRGCADMMGGLAAVITALREVYRGTGPSAAIHLHLVADEERGGNWGTAQLAAAGMLAADACLIPEPTGLAVSVADRGVMWVRLRTTGTGSGGGRPYVAESAIVRAARIVADFHGVVLTTADDLLDNSPCNVGTIQAGTFPNAAPAEAFVGLDVRLTTSDEPAAVLHRIREMASGAATEVLKLVPASRTDAGHPLVGLLTRQLGTDVVGSPGPSDARYYRALGISTVLCGPGDPRFAHRPDEHVSVDSLVAATQAYAHVFASFTRAAR
jgi:succinyl-diaminopimelate desuccinylase